MKVIDLDALFKQYLLAQIRAGANPEQLEEDVPDLYLEWLERPMAQLEGKTPREWFEKQESPQRIEALCAYVNEGVDPPDPLLDAIEDDPEAEELLYELLCGRRGAFHTAEKLLRARRYAAELLNQKGSRLPVREYLALAREGCEDEKLREAAVVGLAAMGEDVKEELLEALRGAPDEGADCLLDLLSLLGQDERIFDALIRHFRGRYEQRALCASLLARYGDERALPVLEEALGSVGYLDFCALRDAIEALGGVVSEEPDFSGDKDYERMRLGE